MDNDEATKHETNDAVANQVDALVMPDYVSVVENTTFYSKTPHGVLRKLADFMEQRKDNRFFPFNHIETGHFNDGDVDDKDYCIASVHWRYIGDATIESISPGGNAPDLRHCAFDLDECTVTLAFDNEAQTRSFIEYHSSRNRVRVIDDEA